ncbi:nucleotidyl transferase AbiEii/AbiGii toxin family protein [Frigoribacterium sp. UYMn621]|uniref:nucleotidyl transferase AbiEii/AbiGii toxin family protein n=1 Tax=Frigoribacterium sp. UYMn621 TaxID=3156343 RepID=UPI003391888B
MTGDEDALAALQLRVTSLLLDAVADAGFVLAGAGAIRQWGLTDRPTEDVDLFAGHTTTAEQFRTALEAAETALVEAGFEVSRSRVSDSFARFHLNGQSEELLDVDFGVNWRADAPVSMIVGPVLSERDAVAGKLSAVYSRGEVRDFLDLDSIRATGRFTDAELLALGREHDDGFDTGMFAAQLSRIATILPTQAAQYGVTADEFAHVQRRTLAWAVQLRNATAAPGVGDSNPRPPQPPARPGRSRRPRLPPIDRFGADPLPHNDPPGPSL